MPPTSLLCMQYGEDIDVAVRSSATAEDLPTASFAGQQETYLNIRGTAQLLDACRRCFASLFTDRAISYRIDQGFDHFKVALSIGVMKMVRSDLASSGVMFTIDTETGFRDVVLINGSYGLGENIVQGAVNPDEFYVFKPTLRAGYRPIIRKKLGEKRIKMIYGNSGAKVLTRNVEVPEAERRRFCLTDDEILELARYAMNIEEHYSKKAGRDLPMDIEWARDGRSGELFIVQARPETVQSQKAWIPWKFITWKRKDRFWLPGSASARRSRLAPARVITDVHRMSEFRPGEILVADTTTPDWEPVMKTGGSRRHQPGRTNLPCGHCQPGAGNSVHRRDKRCYGKDRDRVRMSLSAVRKGTVERFTQASSLSGWNGFPLPSLHRPRTKIMMNLGNPDEAFALSRIPNDGVGLARMEFIINQLHQGPPHGAGPSRAGGGRG